MSAATQMVPADMPAEQADILQELLTTDADLSVVIPDDAEPERVFRTLDISCGYLGTVKRALARLKPVVGRVLSVIQEKELYRERGYEKFDDFLAGYVEQRLGMSRQESYLAMRIPAKFPTMPLDRYERIGPSRMDKLMRAGIDESQPQAERWLQAAESGGKDGRPMPLKELTNRLAENAMLEKEGDTYVPIVIGGTPEVADEWETFCSDPRIQAYCGSDNRGQILLMLMQECKQEWMTQIEEQLRISEE